MTNTTRTLWALGAYANLALLAFACASDTVGSEGQGLDPASSTTAGSTTGAIPETGSSVGGAEGTMGSSTTTGASLGDQTTLGSTDSGTTTNPVTSGTTGSERVTTTGGAGTSAAGGTAGVSPASSTVTGAGGASGTTETTTDAGSTAAGGTSTAIDDPECEEFCDLFFEACADEVEDSFFSDDLYPDHESCMAVCVTFEKGGNYGSDTLGCRRAHIVDNPDGGFHCTHASESGGGQCPPDE